MNKILKHIPIFPLNGALLLPGGNLPLNIFEPRYIDMVDYALSKEKLKINETIKTQIITSMLK